MRRLDDETLARLRVRAAEHGVSMEEEARRIIREAVSPPRRLGDLAVEMFGPAGGIELDLPTRSPHDEPLKLSE